MSALFAAADLQGWLQPGSGRPLNVLEAIRKIILDGRDDVIALKDFHPRKDEKPKGMAASLADAKGKAKGKTKGKDKGKDQAAGKEKDKAKDKTKGKGADAELACTFCAKPGHDAGHCWFNPQAPGYRGPKQPPKGGAAAVIQAPSPMQGAAAANLAPGGPHRGRRWLPRNWPPLSSATLPASSP